MAFAPAPEGAFNRTVYDSLNEVIEESVAIVEAAREVHINPRRPLKLMPGSQPDKTIAAEPLHTMLSVG